jgi:hypothetical protein
MRYKSRADFGETNFVVAYDLNAAAIPMQFPCSLKNSTANDKGHGISLKSSQLVYSSISCVWESEELAWMSLSSTDAKSQFNEIGIGWEE